MNGTDPICANCGAPLAGAYCASCGQEAHEVRSFLAWTKEALSELLSLDGRTMRTVRDLLKPGLLSEDWAAGRRARHLTPLRVFLLGSLAFLSIAFLLGPPSPQEGMRSFNDEAIAAVARRTAALVVGLAVPVIALVLAAVFMRRRRWFLEHVVFTLHMGGFALTMLGIAWLVAHAGDRPERMVGLALVGCGVVTLVWTFLAIRRFYRANLLYSLVGVVAIVASLAAIWRPLAMLADREVGRVQDRRIAEVRTRAQRAYAIALRDDLPHDARRGAAIQAYGAYRELDRTGDVAAADREPFACLARGLGMPGQAAVIADSATVARCPAGL